MQRVLFAITIAVAASACTSGRQSYQKEMSPAGSPGHVELGGASSNGASSVNAEPATPEDGRAMIDMERSAMDRTVARIDSLRAQRRALESKLGTFERSTVAGSTAATTDLALSAPEHERIAARVYFSTNSARLTTAAQRDLAEKAKILRAHPELSLVLTGHTDARGGEAYNQRLSERRADAALQYLVARGIAADRVSAEGLGEREPLANGRGAAALKMNRRVEFSVR